MSQRNIHHEIVEAWRDGWAGTLPRHTLVDVFERALDALWRRAHLSLGEITLMAIVDRVLHQGTEQFPHLALLKVETGGLNFSELRQSARSLDGELLERSLVFLVCEVLRVLGVLTGEVLTPGLHAELRKVPGRGGAEQGGKT